MRASVLEDELGTNDKISNSARHDDFVRSGSRRDSGGDVDGKPSDVVAAQLDFAGVSAGSDGEPFRTERGA